MTRQRMLWYLVRDVRDLKRILGEPLGPTRRDDVLSALAITRAALEMLCGR